MKRKKSREKEVKRKKAREKAREKARGKVKKRKKVKMKSEKKKEGYDAQSGDDPWGVPTYPGAWTANLQLPCGSGLGGG